MGSIVQHGRRRGTRFDEGLNFGRSARKPCNLLIAPVSRLPHAPAGLVTAEKLGILLRDRGCVVVDSLFSDSLATVRVELERVLADGRLGDNNFDGYATRRVFDPLARTRVLDELLLHDLIAATVDAVIGAAQLGMTVVSDVRPGEVAQRLHRDTAVYPLPPGTGLVMVNTIWAIDDFAADNGATLLATNSHLETEPPTAYGPAGLVPAEMGAGSVLVYDGRLVHGAGRNDTSSGRRTDNRARRLVAATRREPLSYRAQRSRGDAADEAARAARLQPARVLPRVRGRPPAP